MSTRAAPNALDTPSFNEVILLLVLAIGVAIISQKARLPYSIGLVIFGVVIGVFALQIAFFRDLAASGRNGIFSQDIFFGILLPPLVYDAAVHINFYSIRANARMILFLTFIGVVVSTLITGYLFASLTAMPLIFALLLGAILSPTDAIAVVDLFKRVRVLDELSTMIESESLLNDAIGIVAFVAVSQLVSLGRFELADTLREFSVSYSEGSHLGWPSLVRPISSTGG